MLADEIERAGFWFWVAAVGLVLAATHANGQTPVLTRSYNNSRCGANISESVLTPDEVLTKGMTKQLSLKLAGDDPRIEAQPLYVPGLVMNDGKKHDTLYVFSMSNRIWAFDLNTGAAIWMAPVSLGPPFLPDPKDPVDSKGINKSFGILSTPVIDRDAEVMYVVYWLSDEATHKSRTLQVAALRLKDGQAVVGKPALPIQASFTNASGKKVSLNQVQKQRAALLLTPLEKPTPLAHRMLYVAFTGQETPPVDGDPNHANHG